MSRCKACKHNDRVDDCYCGQCIHQSRKDNFEPKEPINYVYGVLYEGYTIPSQFHHSFNRLQSVNAGRSDYKVVRYVIDEDYHD